MALGMLNRFTDTKSLSNVQIVSKMRIKQAKYKQKIIWLILQGYDQNIMAHEKKENKKNDGKTESKRWAQNKGDRKIIKAICHMDTKQGNTESKVVRRDSADQNASIQTELSLAYSEDHKA